MTVRELRKQLVGLPADMPVKIVVDGPYGAGIHDFEPDHANAHWASPWDDGDGVFIIREE